MQSYHAVIIGAGAAGLHAAAFAVKGGKVLVVDHAKAPGEKVRISGGGRCNFTNLHSAPEAFISENVHFAKSALARYTQWDFINLVKKYKIPFHEKTKGQLFCDNSSRDIVSMLLNEMKPAELLLGRSVTDIDDAPEGFAITLSDGTKVTTKNLVVACGGKSIPKMGATGMGYRIAEDFGHRVTETRPALVPLVFDQRLTERFSALSGISLPVRARTARAGFEEGMLFTHRGLSGPSILQISSYWQEGTEIEINLCPNGDPYEKLREIRTENGRRSVASALSAVVPARVAGDIAASENLLMPVADMSDKRLRSLADRLVHWRLQPIGTEGYRTAEVTVGGVSTVGLDSQTMESRTVRGLFFIGEVVDVTGWLGGYNFQWAWSSGHAAGVEIARRGG